jgi:thiamine pyrophosphate-dependent acetolactate synthase large subunit-like protein
MIGLDNFENFIL